MRPMYISASSSNCLADRCTNSIEPVAPEDVLDITYHFARGVMREPMSVRYTLEVSFAHVGPRRYPRYREHLCWGWTVFLLSGRLG